MFEIKSEKRIRLLLLVVFIAVQPFLTAKSLNSLPDTTDTILIYVAIVSALGIFYFIRRNQEQLHVASSAPITSREWLVILLLFAVAAFLRLWRLGSLFEGMEWDEAYKGLDAIAIREFHERPIFLAWNAQREALVAYLVAFSQTVLGTGISSVRIVMALAGALSIPLLYLVLRNLFQQPIAPIGAFCLAISKWHIIHSRFGVRVALYPFFELLVLVLLLAGLRARRYRIVYLVLAGLATGLGFYTYSAYRVFPAAILVLLFLTPLRVQAKQMWKGLGVAFVLAAVVVLPLVTFFLNQPHSLTSRMGRTAIWRQADTDDPAHLLIVNATLNTLGMFTYSGDGIVRNNVDRQPMLSPFLCPFFLIGLLASLANIRKPYFIFFLSLLFLGLLPGFLTVHAPQASRTLGAVIPAYFMIAIGLVTTVQFIRPILPSLQNWIIGVLLAGAALTNIQAAMIDFPRQLDSTSSYTSALYGMDRDQTEVVKLMEQLGGKMTIFVTPQFYFHSTVQYLTYQKTPHFLYYSRIDLIHATKPGTVAIVFAQPNFTNLWWLRDTPDKDFFKWWRQNEGRQDIHEILADSYWTHKDMTYMADLGLLKLLKQRYPKGKIIRYDHFSAFIYRP